MSDKMPILDFCDRIEIIHMPNRVDRMVALKPQLARIGISIDDPKVHIPHAPTPADPFGFPSKGVHGNFLSHLDILTRALNENRKNVLILEDDAIFRSLFSNREFQQRFICQASKIAWDFCFIGHSVNVPSSACEPNLVQCNAPFKWSHCYLVNGAVLPRLVNYLNKVLHRQAGHPDGGKMYIDGALSMFRTLNPDCVCLISKPCISIQAGSPSGLGGGRWYDHNPLTNRIITSMRRSRDEIWRATGCFPTR